MLRSTKKRRPSVASVVEKRPLWEAMLGGHEAVAKLLIQNGASIHHGDVGHFACTAAEQNKLNLLNEIVRYGGDVTSPRNNGTTALHVAVCEDNTEIVRFLLDQGADIDKPDVHGWTPRNLADQQGHEEIKFIFQIRKEAKTQSSVAIPEKQEHGIRFLGRFTSEPTTRPLSREGSFQATDESWSQNRSRSRTNNFDSSLFGMMSAAHKGKKDSLFPISHTSDGASPARVTISCPEKEGVARKLILLPNSLQALLEIGAKIFDISLAKVMSKDKEFHIQCWIFGAVEPEMDAAPLLYLRFFNQPIRFTGNYTPNMIKKIDERVAL